MAEILYQKKTKMWRKCIASFVAFTFSLSLVSGANAQYITNLPKPGEMVLLSPAFEPAVLKGMTIHPENPLQFDFIVDRGQDQLTGDELKDESQKLLKYFLAAMTIPDDDAWVNLSPYENDRIIPDMLGGTDMGKAMLEQDYLLKQLSASLTNPQEEIGKRFWNTVYKKAFEKFGTTTIPINTFNKVWIIPDRAVVLEEDGYVYIGETHLKVMLDEDYTSVKENLKNKKLGTDQIASDKVEELSNVSSEVVREIIIPELEKEINQGKNFAAVRQIYNSVILATWYKQALKDSLLGRIYVDKSKIIGVDIAEKDIKQKVYEQYLAAFRKGVYNLIKEDYDLASKETLPRKYFSGGFEWKDTSKVLQRLPMRSSSAVELIRQVNTEAVLGRSVRISALLAEQRREAQLIAQEAIVKGQAADEADVFIAKLLADVDTFNEFVDFYSTLSRTETLAELRAKVDGAYPTIRPFMKRILDRHFGKSDKVAISDFVSDVVLLKTRMNFMVIANRSAGVSSSPLKVQQQLFQQKLKAVFDARQLDEPSRAYFSSLVRAFFNPTVDQKPLIIKTSENTPGNFKPSALLTAQERTDLLGLITYSQLLQAVAPQGGKQKYSVVFSSLDAGLGTSVSREQYVKEIGRTKVGAKGTDLGVRGIVPTGVVSIAEIKLLRLIRAIESGDYPTALGGQITFQPVVSPDSKPSYDELFQQPYLNDILLGKTKETARTYGDVLDSLGVKIQTRIVPFYPGLTTDGNFEPTWDRESSGSHGEVGFKIMLDTLTMPRQDSPQFNVFFNGDGTNNMADHYILDWMAANNVPMVMVSTAKTPLDKKGGQIGVEFLDNGQIAVKMLESGSAKQNGQALDFEHVGLEGGIGEAGKQDFNTNVAIINQALLANILQDVLKTVFKGDTIAMQKIFTPDLISSEKPNAQGVNFWQLEGPIGTVLTNLHNYFATSTDPAVKRIMRKYKVDRMLRIVHVEANNRTRFFTPIKSALDFALQTNSDYYRLNQSSWVLEDTQPGLTPPVINLVGINGKDKYYEDVTNMATSFGRFSVIGLKELTVNGRVLMPNAVFQGKVIINNKTGQTVDLTALKSQIGTTSDGRLLFKDVSIEIKENGDFVKTAIASSALREVDIQVNGEGDEVASANPFKTTTTSSAVIAGKKFLLVEDEATNIEFAKLVLEMVGGATVTAVTSGEKALELMSAEQFDGYILDNTLRDGGGTLRGLDVAKARLAAGDTTPIVFASTDFGVPDSKESLELAELMAANPSVKGYMGKLNLDPGRLAEFESKIASSAVGQATVLVVGIGKAGLVARSFQKQFGDRGYAVVIEQDATEARNKLNRGDIRADVIVVGNTLENNSAVQQGLKDDSKGAKVYPFASSDNISSLVSTISTEVPALQQNFAENVPTALRLADLKAGQAGNITINFPSREKKMIVEVKMDNVGGQDRLSISPYEDGDFELGRLEDVTNRDFWVAKDGTIKKADNQSGEFRGVYFEIGADNKSLVFRSGSGPGTIDYSAFAANADKQVASAAVAKEEPVGGIDFDPSLLNLQIKRNGKGVPLPLPQQNIENINIEGLYPVIINIQPATIQNFPFLSSAAADKQVPELSMR